MAKLRFGNLDAELEGDPKEIVSILRELGVSNKTQRPIAPAEKSTSISPNEMTPISDDELIKKLPPKAELIRMIEDTGKPFKFILAEQQKKIFGTIINTRMNQRAYSRFYDLHNYARNAIVRKYGGHWDSYSAMLDGHQTTEYKWVEDEEIPIIETEDNDARPQDNAESKNASSLLNF
jgi:hypothetical protein